MLKATNLPDPEKFTLTLLDKFASDNRIAATGVRISKLVLYQLKDQSANHTLGILGYFHLCDPAR